MAVDCERHRCPGLIPSAPLQDSRSVSHPLFLVQSEVPTVFPHAQICIRGSDQARPCPRPPHFSLWEASSEARKGALPWINGPAGVCMLPPAQQSLVFSSPPQSQGWPTRTCQQQPSPHPPQSPNSCLCKEIGSEHAPAGAYSIPVAIAEEGPAIAEGVRAFQPFQDHEHSCSAQLSYALA